MGKLEEFSMYHGIKRVYFYDEEEFIEEFPGVPYGTVKLLFNTPEWYRNDWGGLITDDGYILKIWNPCNESKNLGENYR